jgi:hypothetical protein
MIGFILSTYIVHGILCDKHISTYSYQALRRHSHTEIIDKFMVLGTNIYSILTIIVQTILSQETFTIPQVHEHM